jgi:hypothetical protein
LFLFYSDLINFLLILQGINDGSETQKYHSCLSLLVLVFLKIVQGRVGINVGIRSTSHDSGKYRAFPGNTGIPNKLWEMVNLDICVVE